MRCAGERARPLREAVNTPQLLLTWCGNRRTAKELHSVQQRHRLGLDAVAVLHRVGCPPHCTRRHAAHA